MIQRRDKVKQLVMHEANINEIAEALKVHPDTIRHDIEMILAEWRKDVAVKDLWSFLQAFDRLSELDRQFWSIFHQAARQIPMGKRMIVEDRSGIKVEILKGLVETVKARNLMRGIGTPKVFEQIRYLESERSRGFEITRISAEDQMKADVTRLRKDLEWQKREGIIREQPATTT
jgi:hypothetical protein